MVLLVANNHKHHNQHHPSAPPTPLRASAAPIPLPANAAPIALTAREERVVAYLTEVAAAESAFAARHGRYARYAELTHEGLIEWRDTCADFRGFGGLDILLTADPRDFRASVTPFRESENNRAFAVSSDGVIMVTEFAADGRVYEEQVLVRDADPKSALASAAPPQATGERRMRQP